MEIISHRGYWLEPNEKNSLSAFQRSFELGFGTETDVRDRQGELVISHDPPIGGEMLFTDFLKIASDTMPLLALNIKSDGLGAYVKKELEKVRYTNYFAFDMSGPEYVAYRRQGHVTFARVSEYETPNLSVGMPHGVWLDAFVDDSWRLDWIISQGSSLPKIAVVSPELHGRNHINFWSGLRELRIHESDRMILCTDLPEEANLFFGVSE